MSRRLSSYGPRSVRLVVVLVAVLVTTTAAVTVGGGVLGGDDETTIQFRDVADERGIGGASHIPPPGKYDGANRQGVYVTDFDNDGWEDLLVIGNGKVGSINRTMFRNTGGEFTRADVLPTGGQMVRKFKSAVFFDYNNDGWEDLLLLPVRGTPVLLENTGGEFEVRETGVEMWETVFHHAQATTLDYDRDGCLDLFIIGRASWKESSPVGFNEPNETVTDDNGVPNYLFQGDCTGNFERVDDAGIRGEHWSLATSAADFNGDGWPDIHVANDYYRDVVYINQQNGTFDRRLPDIVTARNGMSSEVSDVDGDGALDVFVTNIYIRPEHTNSSVVRNYINKRIGKRGQGNNLLINTGDGEFVGRAPEYGVRDGGWGWAAVVADLDNDGDKDLFHSTNRLGGLPPRLAARFIAPKVWERTDEGFESLNATDVGFELTNGRGVAALDYDHDGDVDIAVAALDDPFRFYENRGASGNSLEIRLERPSGPVTGSDVYVTTGDRTRRYTVNTRTDFLSQDSRTVHVGLDDRSTVDSVRVVWPDGTSHTFDDVEANQLVVLSPDGRERRDRWDGTSDGLFGVLDSLAGFVPG